MIPSFYDSPILRKLVGCPLFETRERYLLSSLHWESVLIHTPDFLVIPQFNLILYNITEFSFSSSSSALLGAFSPELRRISRKEKCDGKISTIFNSFGVMKIGEEEKVAGKLSSFISILSYSLLFCTLCLQSVWFFEVSKSVFQSHSPKANDLFMPHKKFTRVKSLLGQNW